VAARRNRVGRCAADSRTLASDVLESRGRSRGHEGHVVLAGQELESLLNPLDDLLRSRPDLADAAEALARARLEITDTEVLAADVAWAVEELVWEDIGGRIGYQPRRGYVHPNEAAWELLEEAIQPFIDDVNRRAELDLQPAAVGVAVGLVAGLYDCRGADDGTVLGEAGGDDAAFELASWALRTLGDLGLPVPHEALEKRCPDWRRALQR
jgi:hypothetical protein